MKPTNQVFMGRFLKDANSNPYEQLALLTKEQAKKEALSCVTELYRDQILTRYQYMLITTAIQD